MKIKEIRFYHSKLFYYRLQTKFAKVMFLHLSVSHSVHRGGGRVRGVLRGRSKISQGGANLTLQRRQPYQCKHIFLYNEKLDPGGLGGGR